MGYYRKLAGTGCYLSPLSSEDAEICTAWLNDLELTRFLTLAPVNISLDSEREVLQKIIREHNYGIVEEMSDTLIGVTGFVSVDNLNRTGEAGIFIGDKGSWGRGLGTEALNLLLYYGFQYLNLHSITLKVYSFNERARKSYRKCGFQEAGRLREAILREGEWHDVIFMDLLDRDFSWKPRS